MKGFVVLEPLWGGHRMYYVRLLVEGASRRGSRSVLLTSEQTPASAEYVTHLKNLHEAGRFELVLDAGGRSATAQVQLAAELAIARGHTLVVPDADRFLLPLLWQRLGRRRPPTTVLVMRPEPAGAGRGYRARWRAKRLAVLMLRSLGVQVRELRPYLAADAPNRPVAVDPLPPLASQLDVDEARRQLGLMSQRPTFVILGVLSKYKGISLALDAWAELMSSSSDPLPLLVLAGKPTAEVELLLQRETAQRLSAVGALHLDLGYVSNWSLDTYLQAADAALLLYPHEASSGILGRLVQTRTIAVAAGSRTVTDLVNRHELGLVCNFDAASVSAAVHAVVQGKASVRRPLPRETARRSEADFAATLLSAHDHSTDVEWSLHDHQGHPRLLKSKG